MKSRRRFFTTMLLILLAVVIAEAATARKPALTGTRLGKWTISGKVGVTESGSDVGVQGGIAAEYAISKMLSWRTDLNFLFPDLSEMEKVKMNVPSNILAYPFGNTAVFCPYLGPGINVVVPYNSDLQMGVNGVFGAQVRLPGKPVFGMEARYTMPDYTDAKEGDWEVALTGSWQLEF